MLKEISDLLGSLYGAPGYVVTFGSTIVFGYVLRSIKIFPNAGIPVAVVLWGALANIMLADPFTPPASMRLWLSKNLLIGFIIGFVAWTFHRAFLKRFEDKFPWLKGAVGNSDTYKVGQPGWAKEGASTDPRDRISNPPTLAQVDNGARVASTPGPNKGP